MPKIKVTGQTVQTGERKQTNKHTNKRTDRRTDRRYQTYNLPCFAVDNEYGLKKADVHPYPITLSEFRIGSLSLLNATIISRSRKTKPICHFEKDKCMDVSRYVITNSLFSI